MKDKLFSLFNIVCIIIQLTKLYRVYAPIMDVDGSAFGECVCTHARPPPPPVVGNPGEIHRKQIIPDPGKLCHYIYNYATASAN